MSACGVSRHRRSRRLAYKFGPSSVPKRRLGVTPPTTQTLSDAALVSVAGSGSIWGDEVSPGLVTGSVEVAIWRP